MPHTPGPWEVDGAWTGEVIAGFAVVAVVDGVEGTAGPRDPDCDDSERESWANARLIAAAPELLALVETATKLLRIVSDSEYGHMALIPGGDYFYEAAEPILAKAKGQP